MKAPTRLCLNQSRTKVVLETDRDAAILLCPVGADVPAQWVDAVKELLKPPVKEQTEEPLDVPMVPVGADAIESRETRIPKVMRKRGRPRLSSSAES